MRRETRIVTLFYTREVCMFPIQEGRLLSMVTRIVTLLPQGPSPEHCNSRKVSHHGAN